MFNLPKLTTSHCVNCNCVTWRTVCRQCVRGEKPTHYLGTDRRHNGQSFLRQHNSKPQC